MTEQKPNGAAASGPGGGPTRWDFRLDRSGLMVAAGRYLQLQVSLGLLVVLVGVVAGWGTVQLEWLPM